MASALSGSIWQEDRNWQAGASLLRRSKRAACRLGPAGCGNGPMIDQGGNTCGIEVEFAKPGSGAYQAWADGTAYGPRSDQGNGFTQME